jgi:hypothetical protein
MPPKRRKSLLTLEELRHKASLTIPEACRLKGCSRQTIAQHLGAGDYQWFWEGARQMIITDSIFEFERKKSALDMGIAS